MAAGRRLWPGLEVLVSEAARRLHRPACVPVACSAQSSTDAHTPARPRCRYRDTSSNDNFYCKVGEYHVLASAFPSYNNPVVKNSTYTKPVPSGGLAAPTSGKDKQYGCVMNQNSAVEGVSGAIPGGLYIDPSSGGYACHSVYPSQQSYTTTVSTSAGPGQYAVPAGSSC